jgi:hypothetical protein
MQYVALLDEILTRLIGTQRWKLAPNLKNTRGSAGVAVMYRTDQ